MDVAFANQDRKGGCLILQTFESPKKGPAFYRMNKIFEWLTLSVREKAIFP